MADERFQDFPQKTNPTGSDELVGVDGSGYFRSPVSSLPSSGGVAVENEGSSVESAASTLNFVGDGVTATDEGSGQVDITIPAGSSIDSLDAADVLEGDEILPALQTGSGVQVTTSEILGSAMQKLVGYDAQRLSSASLLIDAPDGFTASDGDLYGTEPIVCKIDNSGSVEKTTGNVFNYGVALLETNSNGTAYAGVHTSLGIFVAGPESDTHMGFSMMPKQLPTSPQRARCRAGWMQGTGGGTYDQGMYFESRFGEANWMCVMQGDTSTSEIDSGVAVEAWASAFSEIPRFRLHFSGVDDRTTFYINGALVATFDNVLDGNGFNAATDCAMSIEKTEGTANAGLLCDTICVDTIINSQARDCMP